MLDARGEPRLVQQHRDELRILGEVRVQPLDRHRARESDRPDQPPEVDRRHSTGGDFAVDGVAPHDPQGGGFRCRFGHCRGHIVRRHGHAVDAEGLTPPWRTQRVLPRMRIRPAEPPPPPPPLSPWLCPLAGGPNKLPPPPPKPPATPLPPRPPLAAIASAECDDDVISLDQDRAAASAAAAPADRRRRACSPRAPRRRWKKRCRSPASCRRR